VAVTQALKAAEVTRAVRKVELRKAEVEAVEAVKAEAEADADSYIL